MASNRKTTKPTQPKTSLNSDPLTGEWHGGMRRLSYLPGAVVMQVRDYDPSRREFPHQPIPLRIHSHVVKYHLGGPELSPDMSRYWNGPLAPPPARSYAHNHWWTPEWAERELRAFFPAEAVDIVLAVRRDGVSWDDAMIGASMAMGDVKWQMRRMAQHCRRVLKQQRASA